MKKLCVLKTQLFLAKVCRGISAGVFGLGILSAALYVVLAAIVIGMSTHHGQIVMSDSNRLDMLLLMDFVGAVLLFGVLTYFKSQSIVERLKSQLVRL